ncbi:MAG: glycoside-pentoside-hexuronide (GPH):cation symporter, partial [Lachnospiraceae bacterium]|nr:glycoside-pentoside-hexuronide (GPH):cation symporter [Lachnospiraceae bacterium]
DRLNAVMLYLLFAAPPSLSGNGLVAYAAVTYILWGVTYTMMDIPYWSMIPAFTEGGKERENLTSLARSCAGVGSALVTILTMMCILALGGGNRISLDFDSLSAEDQAVQLAAQAAVEREGFRIFALIIAIIFVVFITITCICVKEKSTVDMESPSVGQMFKALIQNDQAMTVVITIVLVNCSLYITSNLLIYFFKYDVAGTNWYGTYTLFNSFGGGIQIISMMLFYPLLRKFFSSIKIFNLSIIFAIAGYGVLFLFMCLGVHNLVALCVPGFFIFVAFGMLTVLTTVFLANTVDYGELKNNRRDESVIFSMQTFVVKLASGVAVFIASICLQLSNLSKDTSNVDEIVEAVDGSHLIVLRMTMALIPIIGFIIACIIFRKKYILTDEKLAEISETLRG